MSNTPTPPTDGKWRAIALVCLPVIGMLLLIMAIYLVRPRDSRVVVYHYEDGGSDVSGFNNLALYDGKYNKR